MSKTRPDYVHFYPGKWRTATMRAQLTTSEEGMYARICNWIADTGTRLPVSAGARLTGTNTNEFRKLCTSLLQKGLIHEHSDGYGNDKAEKAHKAAADALAAKIAGSRKGVPAAGFGGAPRPADPAQRQDRDNPVEATTPPVTPQVTPGVTGGVTPLVTQGVTPPVTPPVECELPNEINGPFSDKIKIENREEEERRSSCVDASAREGVVGAIRETQVAARTDHDALQAKLLAAANGSLANFAAAPGLLNLSTPRWWLEQGCDLDRDVLPAIAEVGRRKHGAGISSWEYFTKPVTAAKAKRLRALPEVPAEAGGAAPASPEPAPPADKYAAARAIAAKEAQVLREYEESKRNVVRNANRRIGAPLAVGQQDAG